MLEPTHLKNICKSNWIIFPGSRGENIKNYLKPPNPDYTVSPPRPKLSWNFSSYFVRDFFFTENPPIFQGIFVISFGCFLKWWYPQNSPKWSFLVGKPMVVGYHHFRKPPFRHRFSSPFLTANSSLAMPQSGMQSAMASSTHFAIGSGLGSQPWRSFPKIAPGKLVKGPWCVLEKTDPKQKVLPFCMHIEDWCVVYIKIFFQNRSLILKTPCKHVTCIHEDGCRHVYRYDL